MQTGFLSIRTAGRAAEGHTGPFFLFILCFILFTALLLWYNKYAMQERRILHKKFAMNHARRPEKWQ